MDLEVKTLSGSKVILSDVPLDETVEELYRRVQDIETTMDGKWKLMLVTPKSARTLKWNNDNRSTPLHEYPGVEAGNTYRVEVILDMGACHMKRTLVS